MQSHDGRQTDWTEEDKIYLALQLFQQRERRSGARSSASAAQVLFEHLATYQPDWEDIPLPTGRTVAQGRTVFNIYSRQSTGPSTGQSAGPSPGSYALSLVGSNTGGVPSRKRSAPGDALTPPIGRPLAPKQPSSFAAETNVRPTVTSYQPISPMVEPRKLAEPRKKRGRPTKQEAEERRRLMEERQQRRLQAQAAQTAHSSQTPHSISPFGQPYRSPMEAGSYGPQNQPPPEPAPSGAVFSPPLAASTQTPRRPVGEEQTSSGSSGKRRKLRDPRSHGVEPELPQPPTFRLPVAVQSNMLELQSQPGVQGDPAQYSPQLRRSPGNTEHVPGEPESARFEAGDEARPPNRSRPWEVMERSGP